MMSRSSQKKKKRIFVLFSCSEVNFFNTCVLSPCILYGIHFQNIHTFTYQKPLLHTLLLLAFKIIKSLQCILKMLHWSLFFWLNWGSYVASIAKTPSKKTGALTGSMKFLSPNAALYLYKFMIVPCMEYCCHVWAYTPRGHSSQIHQIHVK